jgi:hypothetical protein
MSIMQYILAIAADLRAKDYAKLLQDFIGLIALIATVKTPDAATLAGQMPTLRGGSEVRTFDTDPNKLADECERFAHSQHLSAGMGDQYQQINWAGLLDLIIKLLPLIIGGR